MEGLSSPRWTRTRTMRSRRPGVEAFKAGGHDGRHRLWRRVGPDLGKLIAFQAGQTPPVWDFEEIDEWWTRDDAKASAPIIAVPTTAGTGTEVARTGYSPTRSRNVKKTIILHPKLLPASQLCDPELTVGMPQHHHGWHQDGAFAYCPGSLFVDVYHPMSQGIASRACGWSRTNCRWSSPKAPTSRRVRRCERCGRGAVAPEGARRNSRARRFRGNGLQHPSWHEQCGVMAAVVQLKPGLRSRNRIARAANTWGSAADLTGSMISSSSCALTWVFPTRARNSAWDATASTR